MALIKFNQIAQASGKVNGTIFASGLGGQYMKNWKKPTNPQSARQIAVRADLAGLAAAWRGLTDAQRLAWAAAAPNYPALNRFGDAYTPSGYQLYMTLNSNLLAVGASVLTVPANPTELTALVIDTFITAYAVGVWDSMDIVLSGAGTVDEKIMCECSAPGSVGIQSIKSVSPRFIQNAAATTGTFDLSSDYPAKFGNPPIGSKIFCKVFIVSTTTGQKILLGTATSIVIDAP